MENVQKPLQMNLIKFQFTNIDFKINENFIWPEKGGVKLDPKLFKKITKLNESTVKVELFFEISNGNIKQPFDCNVTLMGIFAIQGCDKGEIWEILAKENAVNILFPYLRQTISTLTSISGLPTYTLPILNTQTIKEI